MRTKIVLALLLVLFAATAGLALTRGRVAYTAPAPPEAPSAGPASSASATPLASASAAGSASAHADAGPAKLMDRPLRVVALGWDLLAPAVLANGGLEPKEDGDFSVAGVPASLRPVEAMASVEGALARGGADKDGADIAVVPFSELVASYERLRALSPEVFLVVGWSRGREALVSTKDALPQAGSQASPGPLSTDAKPGDKPAVSMLGAPGAAATFLGLFALRENGFAPGAVRLLPPPGAADDPALAAVDRDTPGESARHAILVTTADASRLVPFVAVAQHGLVEKNAKALVAFSRVWLEGEKKLDLDAPAAARAVAAAPGAPEPIALLKRLGEIAPSSLADNARAFGLSGRGALTLEALFQESWRIWRGAGALATPAPDAAPIDGSIIASLARSTPALAAPPAKPKSPTGNPEGWKALVTYRQPEGKADEAALLATTGLLADVFERSALRVVVARGGAVDTAATKRVVDEVEQRFDVAPGRVIAGKKVPAKAAAAVEVLAAP